MSVAMEQFFPMPEGPGADVMFDRWRQMARIWCGPGVVRGVLEELAAAVWTWDQPDPAVLIAPGAIWVGGCFGEIAAGGRWIGVPGNVGLIVARMDPISQRVELDFKVGAGHGATEDPDNEWEVALVRLNGPGDWLDVRTFIPLVVPPPPVTEMPPYTPRGFILAGTWPPTQTDIGPGSQEIYAWNIASHPRYIPGRNYRFTLQVGRELVARIGDAGVSWAGNMQWGIRDDAGERWRTFIHNGGIFGNTYQPANTGSFIVGPAYGNATFFIVNDSTGTTRLFPNAIIMNVYDVGGT
jgi:hypothetical protein